MNELLRVSGILLALFLRVRHVRILLRRMELKYTRNYCEENVYHLLEKTIVDSECPFDKALAVWISSNRVASGHESVGQWSSQVPYRPYESEGQDDLLIWDYHVIGVFREGQSSQWYVIDLDSKLPRSTVCELKAWQPFCIPLREYVEKSFFFDQCPPFESPILSRLLEKVAYRVVCREEYLQYLRSDRSHMQGGQFSAPPEPVISGYPSWVTSDQRNACDLVTANLSSSLQLNNIACFINMRNFDFPGRIVNRWNLVSCIVSQ